MKTMVVKRTGVLPALAGSTWGASLLDMLELYIRAVLPQTLYCTAPRDTAVEFLEYVQHRAGARIISRAFRPSSKHALNIETFFLPTAQQLTKATGEAYIRMPTAPPHHQIHQVMRKPIEASSRDACRILAGRANYQRYIDTSTSSLAAHKQLKTPSAHAIAP